MSCGLVTLITLLEQALYQAEEIIAEERGWNQSRKGYHRTQFQLSNSLSKVPSEVSVSCLH